MEHQASKEMHEDIICPPSPPSQKARYLKYKRALQYSFALKHPSAGTNPNLRRELFHVQHDLEGLFLKTAPISVFMFLDSISTVFARIHDEWQNSGWAWLHKPSLSAHHNMQCKPPLFCIRVKLWLMATFHGSLPLWRPQQRLYCVISSRVKTQALVPFLATVAVSKSSESRNNNLCIDFIVIKAVDASSLG